MGFLLLRYAPVGERLDIRCLLGSGDGSPEMAVPKNEGRIERQKQSISFRSRDLIMVSFSVEGIE